jgi:hypothetical protein
VLSKKRKLKGRHRITSIGTKGRNTADRQRGDAAREPLLLATSLSDSSSAVVDMYSMRMQIEETFRDLKSYRYGWSLEDIRCRTAERIDVILLIAALAAVATHVVGLAARRLGLNRSSKPIRSAGARSSQPSFLQSSSFRAVGLLGSPTWTCEQRSARSNGCWLRWPHASSRNAGILQLRRGCARRGGARHSRGA